ncbi:MAG: YraN family protein [Gemmatimonadetes bacterium]|nr:YraN family protein [Gemmatimonadota bacterium]
MEPVRLGSHGEALARRHLEGEGWTVLAANVRAGREEIDLVARRAEVVAFVEVKTRSSDRFGVPAVAVNARKRGRIRRVARAWLQDHPQPGATLRFDVVSIVVPPSGRVRIDVYEDAWR